MSRAGEETKEHRRRIDEAKAAINAVFADLSVNSFRGIMSMEELIEEANRNIDAFKEDLRKLPDWSDEVLVEAERT